MGDGSGTPVPELAVSSFPSHAAGGLTSFRPHGDAGMHFNPREARRIIGDSAPFALFLSIPILTLIPPLLLRNRIPGDLAELYLTLGLSLQLLGVMLTAGALLKKARGYEIRTPGQKFFEALKLIPSIFRKPRIQQRTAGSSAGASASIGITTIGEGYSSLEGRIVAVERQMRKLDKSLNSLREDVERMHGEVSGQIKALDRRMVESQHKERSIKVDSFDFEWVGVGWVILGIISTVVAECYLAFF